MGCSCVVLVLAAVVVCPRADNVPELCTLPYSTGNCSDYREKWYFVTKDQRCRQFYFSGCGGNGNKFDIEQECMQRCALTPSTTTVVPSVELTAATAAVPRPDPDRSVELSLYPDYTHHVKSCSPHEYKCYDGSCVNVGLVCNGVPNCAENEDETGCVTGAEILSPESKCKLPPYPAHGTYTAKPGYAYDTIVINVTCKQGYFLKGSSSIDCYNGRWLEKMPICVTVCNLESESGPCHNFSSNWFYNMEYGGCSRFWYSGCEGNGNRFGSKEECEDTCVSPPPKDACKLPQIKGPCLGYNVRWYYDNERETCTNFVYGGCLGNNNNFETQELCQKQCEPEKANGT